MQGSWKRAFAPVVGCAMLGGTAMALAGGNPVVTAHTFDPSVLLPISGDVTWSVAVGDVTGDQRDDIVVVTGYVLGSADDKKILVYRQAADGTLLAPLRFPHQPLVPSSNNNSRFGLALGRLNADKALDIVVGDADGYTVLMTSPSGFVSTWVDTTGRTAEAVAVLDVDRDGHDDIFGQSWNGGAMVLHGDGQGHFARRTDIATPYFADGDLKVGDLNGDGTLDVLMPRLQGYTGFNFYPIAPAGGWLPTAMVPYSAAWSGPVGGAIADFNGDGITDIATSDYGNAYGYNTFDFPYIHVFPGQGQGKFGPGSALATANNAGSLSAGDFDGNGMTDLMVMHWGMGQIGYYLQGANGLEAERTVLSTNSQPFSSPFGVGVGDIDSNGCLDMVAVVTPGVLVYKGRNCRRAPRDFDLDHRSDILWRNAQTGANAVWKAGNSARQMPVTGVNNLAWKIVGQGDFDGDSKTDVLWRNGQTGANAIWRSADNAAQIPVASMTNLQWTIDGVGDFNGDGKADLLWRNATTGQNTLWHSANQATSATLTTVAAPWQVAGVGDFNGDGKSDIVWRNPNDGSNTIWSSGNFSTSVPMTRVSDLAWKIQGIGDFDGDGKSDVFWRNTTTGLNQVWRAGSSSQAQSVTGVTSTLWRVVSVADYDGDGKSDLLWRNSGNGANAIWRSANANTPITVTGVNNMQWQIVP